MVSIIPVLNQNNSLQKFREGKARIAKAGVAPVRQDRANNEVDVQTTAVPERQIHRDDNRVALRASGISYGMYIVASGSILHIHKIQL